MNKEKFLTKLKNRLNVLEDREIEDILSEYESYIDEKIATGMTEEEAVKELGDFEEIVTDLLGAYKVKKDAEPKSGNILNILNKFIESLSKKNGKELLGILIEIILILLFLGFLRLPFLLISHIGENLFENLSIPLGDIFGGIWEFIIDLGYIITSIIIFIKFLENRFFANLSTEILTNAEENKPSKVVDETKEESKKNTTNEKPVANIVLIILKFFCIILLIGVVFYLLGITIGLSLMLYLIFNGIKYYGILLLLVCLFLGGVFFLKLGIKFLNNKKIKAIPIFGELFTIIILTAIGLTISAIEITNTEIIYDKNIIPSKTITETITMKDDLKIFGYDAIKIDNSLNNTIKIEYSYADFLDASDIRVELDDCGYNRLCLEEDIERVSLNKDLLTSFINNLKAKKIIIYPNFGIYKTIYVNEENYKLLTGNTLNNLNPEDNQTFKPNTEQPESESLTYIYQVINIKPALNNNYQYVTLKYSYDNEIETVRISTEYTLEVNKEYKFTFKKPNHFYETHKSDDIDDIFEEYTLISITLNS